MTAGLLYLSVRPQRDAADAEYASFREAARLGVDELAQHDLVAQPLPDDTFDRFSGIFIGGSPFNVADPESTKPEAQRRVEDDLVRIATAALENRTAALFTCYGIGVVTRLLGGEVTRAFPESTGPTVIDLTEGGRADPVFGALANRFTAFTAHKEGTATVPPGATLLAQNEACPVQAYRAGERLYATQFHPEPTGKAFTERMTFYRNDGYFDVNDFDGVAGRVLAASVTEPARMLHAFASRFGTR